MLLPLVLAGLCVSACYAGGQDFTLVANSTGEAIVEAVVDKIRTKCVFPNDLLLVRRAAFVTSLDGNASDTYRQGFHGGIWQINETQFEASQDCNNTAIAAACLQINSSLAIDWSTAVTWSDLRKPLYSGLAFSLLTLLTLNGSRVPGEIRSQAALWSEMYGRNQTKFISYAESLGSFQCTDMMDLVFVLDSSGSITDADFILEKNFTADVVEVMNVSPSVVLIADIVYASGVQVWFDFNNTRTSDQVRSALLSTPKLNSGTNTASALDQAAITLYNYAGSSGARREAKKVAVLITDGQSASFENTVSSARKLKDLGTTVFTIGVGGYNMLEIRAVASEPTCSHVFTLTAFNQIRAIHTEIQKSACTANTILTNTTIITGQLTSASVEKNSETKAPDQNTIIEAEVTCGILDIYISTTNTKPSPAVFDERYQALPDTPAVLTLVGTLPEGTPVYITVVGTKLPDRAAGIFNCSVSQWSMSFTEKRNVTVLCGENGAWRSCKLNNTVDCFNVTSLCSDGVRNWTCVKADLGRAGLCHYDLILQKLLDDPCLTTQDKSLKHRYPLDPTKYIQCKEEGGYNVVSCQDNVIFNEETRECGYTAPLTRPTSKPGGPAGCGAMVATSGLLALCAVAVAVTLTKSD